MSAAHPLISCLRCPVTGSKVSHVQLGKDTCVVSDMGILYPFIDGVLVMNPVAPIIKKKCTAFLSRNADHLRDLGNRIDLDKTEEILLAKANTEKGIWHEKEMAYWESVFENALTDPKRANPGWNRTLPRKKILSRLPTNISKRIILEIGCGATHTLSDIYGKDIPNYIGMDLSFHACVLSKNKFPEGLFVQASVENLPFATNSLDMLVGYGVLHHLPGHEENLTALLPAIKSGGYFVGADPVLKPRIPRPVFLKSSSKLMEKEQDDTLDLRTGMSPHNEWIDWDNLKKVIAGHATIAHTFMEYSVLRHFLVRIFYDRLKIQGPRFTKMIIFADQSWLATLGRLHRALGPAGVQYALKKR